MGRVLELVSSLPFGVSCQDDHRLRWLPSSGLKWFGCCHRRDFDRRSQARVSLGRTRCLVTLMTANP